MLEKTNWKFSQEKLSAVAGRASFKFMRRQVSQLEKPQERVARSRSTGTFRRKWMTLR
ncbi:hypothetical protein [Acidaminococcus sp. LBK-2]|uniref:hypothetical protein n=1 Tax=Acidaminococcus sp. LBK-2 TaxID=3456956 RepID=UPI003FA42950